MKTIKINLQVCQPFGNLFRKRTVLIAVLDDKNQLLLGGKPNFYPPTITRLLGGGVDGTEGPLVAAVREIREELSLDVNDKNITKIADFHVTAVDEQRKKYSTIVSLFMTNIGNQKYHLGDDVKQIDKISLQDLDDLVERYKSLPNTLWYKGSEGEFNWHDYSQLYSVIHGELAGYLRTEGY
jgi:8-oxo-dGTP pyrophosphatase MutT (NUDIX family)